MCCSATWLADLLHHRLGLGQVALGVDRRRVGLGVPQDDLCRLDIVLPPDRRRPRMAELVRGPDRDPGPPARPLDRHPVAVLGVTRPPASVGAAAPLPGLGGAGHEGVPASPSRNDLGRAEAVGVRVAVEPGPQDLLAARPDQR